MINWLRNLFRKDVSNQETPRVQPVLLQAESFAKDDIGSAEWNPEHNADRLTISNKGRTIEWAPRLRVPGQHRPAWIPASTRLHLHSGKFSWDFNVDEMASGQLGIGFMALWNVGPDWGFFGYLGASHTAWSYDPSTGDVVTATESIEGDLPKIESGHTGVVSVELDLPRDVEGNGKFIVDGVETTAVTLPVGAVILPAACFLKENQKVTLANFRRA